MDVIGWIFFITFLLIMAVSIIAPRFTKDQTEEW